eukprot:GEMP01009227.1.p1 GENE.GEMP01009227.1~~GEMP01009227.1.p1  ORF type:complete len:969 (+),score=219.24 GEMP01009227.1:102-3008(+)
MPSPQRSDPLPHTSFHGEGFKSRSTFLLEARNSARNTQSTKEHVLNYHRRGSSFTPVLWGYLSTKEPVLNYPERRSSFIPVSWDDLYEKAGQHVQMESRLSARSVRPTKVEHEEIPTDDLPPTPTYAPGQLELSPPVLFSNPPFSSAALKQPVHLRLSIAPSPQVGNPPLSTAPFLRSANPPLSTASFDVNSGIPTDDLPRARTSELLAPYYPVQLDLSPPLLFSNSPVSAASLEQLADLPLSDVPFFQLDNPPLSASPCPQPSLTELVALSSSSDRSYMSLIVEEDASSTGRDTENEYVVDKVSAPPAEMSWEELRPPETHSKSTHQAYGGESSIWKTYVEELEGDVDAGGAVFWRMLPEGEVELAVEDAPRLERVAEQEDSADDSCSSSAPTMALPAAVEYFSTTETSRADADGKFLSTTKAPSSQKMFNEASRFCDESPRPALLAHPAAVEYLSHNSCIKHTKGSFVTNKDAASMLASRTSALDHGEPEQDTGAHTHVAATRLSCPAHADAVHKASIRASMPHQGTRVTPRDKTDRPDGRRSFLRSLSARGAAPSLMAHHGGLPSLPTPLFHSSAELESMPGTEPLAAQPLGQEPSTPPNTARQHVHARPFVSESDKQIEFTKEISLTCTTPSEEVSPPLLEQSCTNATHALTKSDKSLPVTPECNTPLLDKEPSISRGRSSLYHTLQQHRMNAALSSIAPLVKPIHEAQLSSHQLTSASPRPPYQCCNTSPLLSLQQSANAPPDSPHQRGSTARLFHPQQPINASPRAPHQRVSTSPLVPPQQPLSMSPLLPQQWAKVAPRLLDQLRGTAPLLPHPQSFSALSRSPLFPRQPWSATLLHKPNPSLVNPQQPNDSQTGPRIRVVPPPCTIASPVPQRSTVGGVLQNAPNIAASPPVLPRSSLIRNTPRVPGSPQWPLAPHAMLKKMSGVAIAAHGVTGLIRRPVLSAPKLPHPWIYGWGQRVVVV